jgi:hypothetical protein
MKIGIDFDGVITNSGKLKSDAARMLYGIEFPGDEFKRKIIVEKHKLLPSDEYEKFQQKIFSRKKFNKMLPPVPGAPEYVSRLIAEGHEVLIVTTRIGKKADMAREWLKQQNMDVPCAGIGRRNLKSSVLKDFDMYIDDDSQELLLLKPIVPHLFLFSWKYNQNENIEDIGKRVSSWSELYEKISKMNHG